VLPTAALAVTSRGKRREGLHETTTREVVAERREADRSEGYDSEEEEFSLEKLRGELGQAYKGVGMEMPPIVLTMDEVESLDAVLQVLLRLRLEQATSRSLRAQLARISRSLEVVSDAGSKQPREVSPEVTSQQANKVARWERSLSAPSALPGNTSVGDQDVVMETEAAPMVGSPEWFLTIPLGIRQDVEEGVDEYFDFIMPNPARYMEVFVV
jgi:hypothetical protein